MRLFYLVGAIVGAVVPYIFFADFLTGAGFDLSAFAGALFVNGAAGGFSADLLISSFIFWRTCSLSEAGHDRGCSSR